MFRKVLVIPALFLVLTACGSTQDTTTVGSHATTSASATTSAGEAAGCPTASTKKFAKTRFVADLGLAFGAFHRYIYKPYQAGAFKSGASGRTKALIKAAAAGAFALSRLNSARKLVNEDPFLCKSLKAPLDALATKLSSLTDKLKKGQLDPGLITDTQGTLEGVRQKSGSAGAPIQDQ